MDYWLSHTLGVRSVEFCLLNKFVFWVSSKVLNCHWYKLGTLFVPFKHYELEDHLYEINEVFTSLNKYYFCIADTNQLMHLK